MAPRAHETTRTCLGCRRPLAGGELIRIVRSPSGAAVFDPEGRLPGRGAYVCPSPACVDAITAASLTHVLRAPVTLPDARSRRAALAAALERRAANLLSIARKSRNAAFGAHAVRAAVEAGRAELLLLGTDLPLREAASWRARIGALPLRDPAPAAVLGRWAGRGPTPVAAVCQRGLAATLAHLLDQWRAISPTSCDNDQSGQGRIPGPAHG